MVLYCNRFIILFTQIIYKNQTNTRNKHLILQYRTSKRTIWLRWGCWSAALSIPANLKNSAVATGLEKVSFHSNPKERQCQRMFKLLHNCTHLSSVQFSRSVVSDSATPWTVARHASLSITNSRSLLKLMSIESVMPSSHLILCRSLLLLPSIPPSIRLFSSESTLRMRWPKYWSFRFSISPSNEHPGLISFRMDLLQSKGLSGVFSNTTVQKHQFFGAQLSSQSNSYIHTWPLEKP